MNGEPATHVDQVRNLRDIFEYIHNSEILWVSYPTHRTKSDIQIYKIILLEVRNLFLGVAKYTLDFHLKHSELVIIAVYFQACIREILRRTEIVP
jgi:hypothetical protein